jgi:hypothetical protein
MRFAGLDRPLRGWILGVASVILAVVPSGGAAGSAEIAGTKTPAIASPDSIPQPSPDLSPGEVVKIQVEALRSNDDPREDAGIRTAYRFASPANKKVTGPLERFSRLFDSARYRPMINAATVQYSEIVVDGNLARRGVLLTTSTGKRVGYLFRLSKQSGEPCAGCWMTDGVRRIRVPNSPAQDV